MGGETALAMQGFGVGMQASGAYYAAKGQKASLDAQARVDDVNAKLATLGAKSALLSGQRQEQGVRLNTAQIKSSQRAAQAANGLDLSSTTPTAVRTTTDVVGEVDAITVAGNALRTAFGYQTQALNYTNRARGARASAKGINPWFSAGSSLLSGASSVADSWYRLKQAGAFDTADTAEDYGPRDDWFSRNFGQFNLVSNALY